MHTPTVCLAVTSVVASSWGVYEGVQSSHVLRRHARRTWRPREGARHVHNTAIRRALGPSHPCARVTAGVHDGPRGVAPLRRPTMRRDTSVAAHGRRNDLIASKAL